MCFGESRTLSLVGFASTANTYQWSDANGVIVGATSSSYIVSATGVYSLSVTSANGCVALSNTISISVLSTSVPSSLSASNLGLDKGTMNWASVANAHHYDIRMRVQGSSWSVSIDNIPGSLSSKQKANLQSSTTYEWSIRSACSSDTSTSSAWSSVQSFTTLTPCTSPINSLTSGVTLTGATLGWDAVSGSWGYAVRYKGVSQPWSSWTTVVVTTNSYALTGLSSNAAYHWQVRSVCDSTGVNSSGFGSYATFNTGSCNISFGSQVSTISCNGLSDGSIDITPTGGSGVYTYLWDTGATTEDLSGLSAGTYSVVLSDTWGCLDSATFVITEPAALTSVIHSLGSLSMCFGESRTLSLVGFASTANTYQWSDANGVIVGATSSSYIVSATGVYSLSVTSANGCVALSNTISISVLSTSVPSSLSASNLGLDKGTMNWASVANAHHYDIRMRVQGSSWSVSIDNIPGSLSSKQKANLQSSTTYEWSIRSACSSDTSTSSAWSSVQSFTTLTPCVKPQNTIVSSITSSQAMLGWDVGSAATSYDVRFKLQGSAWGAWQYTNGVTTNQFLQTSLSAGTYYHWQVRAVCGSSTNKSGWTSYNTFSTLSSIRITAGDTDLGVNLNIYPNPTQGVFNISFIAEKVDNFEITIVDAFGKLVSHEDKQDFIGEYTKQVDLSTYPRGIYMVQIKTQDSFVSKRIVLQ